MNSRVYRFGEFQLVAAEGELRGPDSCVQLQEKPLQMLIQLLEHPQQLVTRDRLRTCMWSDDTFVDYEQGINVAVKKLRDALGDSAAQPRYIQTIARKGYRFLLPVEVGDSGEPVELPPERVSAPRQPRSRKWAYAAAPIVFLVLTGFSMLLPRSQSRRHAPIRSIAVLPLQNLSPDADQDYFAAGLTEELITDLAEQSDLRVISHTSVMRYKGTTEPLTKIARELGVDAIVEGSVERSGKRVRVTAQLLDGTDDRHLWAASYDGDLDEVLAVQSRIARQIVAEVDSTVGPQRASRKVDARAVDPQVLEWCMLARYEWNKRTRESLEKAIDYFEQAADRDPTYAPAFAGLASSYFLLTEYSEVPHEPFLAKARAAAEKAIELDETLAEPHATLGMLELAASEYDWNRMDREFRRAVQLNPSLSTAHHWYAFYLLLSGDTERALAEIEYARQLDPLSVAINADEGHFLYAAGQQDAAIERIERAIELEPTFGQPHETLALIYAERGQMSQAESEARRGLALDPNNPRTLGEAGYVLAHAGRRDESIWLLHQIENSTHTGTGFPIYRSFIYLGLGERREAVKMLQTVYDPQKKLAPFAIVEWRLFAQLRGNTEFDGMMSGMSEMRTLPIND